MGAEWNAIKSEPGRSLRCPQREVNSMRKNLQLMATCLAGALVAMAMTPSVADEQFAPTAVVQLPDAQILSAFDISFVDPKSHTLAIASSRVVGSGGPFGTVVIVNTETNLVTKELIPTPPSAGDSTFPPPKKTFSGPNAVTPIEKGHNTTHAWSPAAPLSNTPPFPPIG